jgi:hypothetical protein
MARDAIATGDDLGKWHGAFIPAEHWHFHRRVFERSRMVLPPGAFSMMIQQLCAGPSRQAQRIGKNPLLGREIWGIYVPAGTGSRLLFIVWHPRRRAVITALPQNRRRHAAFHRAREAFREERQRRRLPALLPVAGIPALLRRVSSAIWRSGRPYSRTAATARDAAALSGAADSKVPFFVFEMTVEREHEDLRPAPKGVRRESRFETVFWLKAVLFRPWKR